MRVDQATGQQGGETLLAALRLSLASDDAFRSALTVGQILSGRVLRHIDGSRYAVSFQGQERVVDSSIPLRTNELLHGRVIGLNEKVELARINSRDSDGPSIKAATAPIPSSHVEAVLLTLAQDFGIRIGAERLAELAAAVRGLPDLRAAALSAFAISRFGELGPAREWVRAIDAALRFPRPSRDLQSTNAAVEFSVSTADDESFGARADFALAELLASLAGSTDRDVARQDRWGDEILSRGVDQMGTRGGEQESSDHQDESASDSFIPFALWWMLNGQKDGTIRHRAVSIPLVIDGQLMEFDLACFEQKDPRPNEATVRHRRLVFSLDCDVLGPIHVDAAIDEQRVRLQMEAKSQRSADALSEHAGLLANRLAEFAWTLDDAKYSVSDGDGRSHAALAAIEHVVRETALGIWA